MAQQQQSQDLIIPPPASGPQADAASAPLGADAASAATLDVPVGPAETSPRDMLIGGTVLVVLLVAFFFAKSAYANMLVGKRVPPSRANASGWWLLIFLMSVATTAVMALVNPARFLTAFFVAPMVILALVSAVIAVMSGRR